MSPQISVQSPVFVSKLRSLGVDDHKRLLWYVEVCRHVLRQKCEWHVRNHAENVLYIIWISLSQTATSKQKILAHLEFTFAFSWFSSFLLNSPWNESLVKSSFRLLPHHIWKGFPCLKSVKFNHSAAECFICTIETKRTTQSTDQKIPDHMITA